MAMLRIRCFSLINLPSGMNVSIVVVIMVVIEVQAFVLNFNGRVDKASVKNF